MVNFSIKKSTSLNYKTVNKQNKNQIIQLMKNIILIFSSILLLASCSQKQFTFRKKINVNKAEVIVLKPTQNDVVSVSNPAKLSNDKLVETYQQLLPFVEQTNALSTPSIQVLPDDTIRKKYKFGDDKSTFASKKSLDSDNSIKANNNPRDKEAIVGFILAILSLSLVLSPLAIPGLIYSIKGLKSNKRKGFALAGLIINALVLLFILFFIWLIIVLILGSRNSGY